MGPILRKEALLHCQMQGRHDWWTATPDQIALLSVLVGGPVFEWRYCQRCWSIFGPDGRLADLSARSEPT